MTDREALARVFDPRAWQLRDMGAFTDYPPHTLRIEASLAKADQWISRPSPVDGVVEALRDFARYGCPACNGDCGAANPPILDCPMQKADRALTAYDQAKGETQ